MKKWLLLLSIFVASFSYADQLAYISKEDADKAVALISKMKTLYLFCGCCQMEKPIRANIVKVYAKHTGYEEYYEVYIDYINERGETLTEQPLDLAYVWRKKTGKYKTIGQLLELEHDYCVLPKNWDKPQENTQE
jgi:hypothetical protein